MNGSRQDITVGEAQRLILSSVAALGPEDAPLREAPGRVLAADVRAPRDAPAFDNSAMDGFAVRHADAAAAPSLRVVGLARAGDAWEGTLRPGEAVKIMTGAKMPDGADTVVMKEVCTEAHGAVTIADLPPMGLNVRHAGEDIRAGEIALRAGTTIGPVEIAALAGTGMARAPVRARPVVAILSTGNELVEVGGEATGDRIHDSNSHAIAALVESCGAVPLMLGIARDTPGALAEVFERAAAAHALVTTGGVSVGDYDYVKGSFRALGCREVFWRVLMRPGRPTFFGVSGDRPVFGLPGNAVSCMVTFTALAAPALRAMAGDPAPVPAPVPAVLAGRVTKKAGLVYFTRARAAWRGRRLVATPALGQASHQVFGQRGANALIVAPADREAIEDGEDVDVIPFGVPTLTAPF